MGSLNESKLTEIVFDDFSGGHAGIKGSGTRNINEAKDLDNIVVLPGGNGFRSRNGNDEIILSPTLTGMNVLGAAYGMLLFEYEGDQWILRSSDSGGKVSNEVYLESTNLTGTSSAVDSAYPTASYTFTNDNLIQWIRINNLLIGTVQTTGTTFWPPVQMAMSASGGAGSASLFTGAVAEGRVAAYWNSRMWMGNLTGAQSKVKYSILMAAGVSPAASSTWTNTGSGFVEPARGDGDEVMALVPVSTNIMLLFKKNSIHQIVGRSDPFAVYPLFQGVGAAGRSCAVEAEGLVYFITPDKRMLITDGNKIYSEKDIPALGNAKDLLNGISSSRLYLTLGFRQQGRDYDWIVWMYSATGSSTHNKAIIWDRINQCWLQCSTGYNGNAVTTYASLGTYISGYSNARTYKQDAVTTYADDSYTTPLFDGSNRQLVGINPQAITWYWRTDDILTKSLHKMIHVKEINANAILTATGSVDLSWAYNGLALGTAVSKSLNPASINFNTATWRPLGRGVSFGTKIGGDDVIGYQINNFSITGSQASRTDTNKGLV